MIRKTRREPLKELEKLGRLARNLDPYLRDFVGCARDAGHTWTEIGEALGMTRQAAWERFSSEE
ncbi:MAG: hypothetical protein ACRDKJ_12105 [Actinomycetota bacterium]